MCLFTKQIWHKMNVSESLAELTHGLQGPPGAPGRGRTGKRGHPGKPGEPGIDLSVIQNS